MYTYELFEFENGFGFNILFDSSIIINQVYYPNKDGFRIMSHEEAIKEAQIVLERMDDQWV